MKIDEVKISQEDERPTVHQRKLIEQIRDQKFWKEPIVRERIALLDQLKVVNKKIKYYDRQIVRLADQLQQLAGGEE
mgnify:CR=1 FL=1